MQLQHSLYRYGYTWLLVFEDACSCCLTTLPELKKKSDSRVRLCYSDTYILLNKQYSQAVKFIYTGPKKLLVCMLFFSSKRLFVWHLIPFFCSCCSYVLYCKILIRQFLCQNQQVINSLFIWLLVISVSLPGSYASKISMMSLDTLEGMFQIVYGTFFNSELNNVNCCRNNSGFLPPLFFECAENFL